MAHAEGGARRAGLGRGHAPRAGGERSRTLNAGSSGRTWKTFGRNNRSGCFFEGFCLWNRFYRGLVNKSRIQRPDGRRAASFRRPA
ncbi:hypothetical protein A8H35_09380 [Burkholderia thailandensis]|nr:hypothetical protein A8H31_14000 [Burkholderia thailandensis]AWY58600.1 hypothetical protein A8H35_09380 [Burkholderia thailandensis]AWY67234.1 hypothetical protein A8H36_19060 [Burkholderia thailandensis]NOK42789.1 hypothetical protein [Burkholderia thailandensis]NOK52118.1 hypothetical protein [Burkholderia thailandensis]